MGTILAPSQTAAPLNAPAPNDVASQVQRLLESQALRNADSLRRLLSFVAERLRTSPGEPAKEMEIAIQVFRKSSSDFDPHLDSTVRVQAARLRAKMLEYYAAEGSSDPVLLELCKGSYRLSASYRASLRPPAPVPTLAPETITAPPTRGSLFPILVTLTAGILLGASISFWAAHRADLSSSQGALGHFWLNFRQPGERTLVVFANPKLRGTLFSEGLRYYDEARDASVPSARNFTYTGTGDLIAVHLLTHLFDGFRQNLTPKSGALISWDDAKDSNLVFVGRPEQNPALRAVPRLAEFHFQFAKGIVNSHPQPGESEIYSCSQRPFTFDHAVIALLPGLRPNRRALILAGTTTYGTEAAAEYVTREETAEELLAKLGYLRGEIPWFEALLEIRIQDEVPVHTKLIAIRKRSLDESAWQPAPPDQR